MKYKLLGGGHIEAASPLELVEALRADSQAWAPTVGIEDFMEGYADRCKMQNGAIVRTDSLINFLHDLQAGGFITPQHAHS
jgi:hypothetical protein